MLNDYIFHRFPVHRIVMATSSEYFETLLAPHVVEGRKDEVIIEDIDGPTLKSIIDYCYTGCIDITEENVDSIFAAASKSEFTELVRRCRKFCDARIPRFRFLPDLVLPIFKRHGHNEFGKPHSSSLADPKRSTASSNLFCAHICESKTRIVLQRFDLQSNTWTKFMSMAAREYFRNTEYLVCVDGHIYLIESMPQWGPNRILSYNVSTSEMKYLPNMLTRKMDYRFSPVVVGQHIYVFGDMGCER